MMDDEANRTRSGFQASGLGRPDPPPREEFQFNSLVVPLEALRSCSNGDISQGPLPVTQAIRASRGFRPSRQQGKEGA